ncbi:MAG TPA: cytochrome c1 [Steroidobacteraceae bacterium]|nr:cytochrome c1 [Steroidobacteraceae bacterium]
MKLARTMLGIAVLAWPLAAVPATSGYPLQGAGTDVGNLASLQRGARNFVNYCLGCHSARYMRYSQVADDLALTEDELRENLMFTGTRVYDAMLTSMPADQARQWFGNTPPDLSLIARSRGVDYVYTYLKSFYADPARPTGANNAVLANTVMPHVLASLQGVQQPRYQTTTGQDGKPHEQLVGLEPGIAGEMSAEEFDGFVRDTVGFLEYVSEPAKAQRQSLGVWVILYLLMFVAFAYFLKKEYWKDVKS